MNISGISHSRQFNNGLENIASALIQQKSSALTAVNESNVSQKMSVGSKPENVSQIPENQADDPQAASPSANLANC